MSPADAKTLTRCSSHNCRSVKTTMLAAWHDGARLIRFQAAAVGRLEAAAREPRATRELFPGGLAPAAGGWPIETKSFGFSRLREGAGQTIGAAMPPAGSLIHLVAHGGQADSPLSAGASEDFGSPLSGELCRLPAAYLRHHGAAVRGQAPCFSELTGKLAEGRAGAMPPAGSITPTGNSRLIPSTPRCSAVCGTRPRRVPAAMLPVGSVVPEVREMDVRLSPFSSGFAANPGRRPLGAISLARSSRIKCSTASTSHREVMS